jgi:hypothetical protein
VNRDAAGIDVGNESHFVAVPRGRDAQPVRLREFESWTAALVEMAQWLTRCGIRTVVMQSTGLELTLVRALVRTPPPPPPGRPPPPPPRRWAESVIPDTRIAMVSRAKI